MTFMTEKNPVEFLLALSVMLVIYNKNFLKWYHVYYYDNNYD